MTNTEHKQVAERADVMRAGVENGLKLWFNPARQCWCLGGEPQQKAQRTN
jgi:hypothetical protein